MEKELCLGSENFNAIHDDLSLRWEKKKAVTLKGYLNKSTFRTIQMLLIGRLFLIIWFSFWSCKERT